MQAIANRNLYQEFIHRQSNKEWNDDVNLRDTLFDKQNQVLDARDHRFKAVNCTRRAGKSVGEAIDDIEIMLKYPGSRLVYGGITLDSVTEIIWDVFLEKLDFAKISHKADKTHRIIRLDNESRVRLFGVDSSEKEMRKILGQKLRKATIDEAGSITVDMVRLCYQMIMPALIDLRPNSWLSIVGTCENIPGTFFQKVVEGKESGKEWKVFRWTAYDNPYIKEQWAQEINDLLRDNPKVQEASWFQTHYLNRWVTDDNLIIYDLRKATFETYVFRSDDIFIFCCDLGFNDPTAFSIISFSMKNNKAILVESYKVPGLDFTGVAKEIRFLETKYKVGQDGFYKYVVDGSAKQGVEEMKNRHGIPLEAAEKTDKVTFMRLMDDDIGTGVFTINNDGEKTKDFTDECETLIWKDENKDKEDERCSNHNCDSVLYGWRYAYNYLYRQPEKKISRDSEEYHLLIAKEEGARLERERKQLSRY